MTERALPRPQLPQLVPSLFADRHIIALIAAAADSSWSAAAAWDFARAATTGGRRVLLIDLSADAPALSTGMTAVPEPGIAELFEQNAPLGDAGREQERPGLFFIGRGSPSSGMDPVWRSPRWEKLARGFANEGAMLILYAPAAALPLLEVNLDGVVVLAPRGYDPATAALPGLASHLARGTTLLASVTDELLPRPSAPTRPGARSSRPALRRPAVHAGRPHPWKGVLAVAGAVALVLVAVALWARGAGSSEPRRPPAPILDLAPGDTLFYSVQVARFDALPAAMAHAEELRRDDTPAIVTPERRRGREAWYRVLAGALPSPRAADSLRRQLWARGVLESPQGTIMRVPQAFRIDDALAYDQAASSARALRARGVPAYIVRAPNGLARVYAGAFDLPDQARAIDSLLAASGIRGTLASRMGTTR